MSNSTSARGAVCEWVEVRDGNGRLLFLLSLVTGRVRIKRRELTTEVDLHAVLIERRRAVFDALSAPKSPE